MEICSVKFMAIISSKNLLNKFRDIFQKGFNYENYKL